MPKLLIFEDEPNVRLLEQEVLGRADIDMFFSEDGTLSVPEILAMAPNLIILDLKMPGRSGLAVLAEIKSHPLARSIPVMVVSGSGDMLGVDLTLADRVIVKPFDVTSFRRAVLGYLFPGGLPDG